MGAEFYETGVSGHTNPLAVPGTNRCVRPHTILTFIALEQHKKVWRWMNEDHTLVMQL